MERQGEWKHMKPKQEWSEPAVLVKPGMEIRLKDIDPAPKPALAKNEVKAKVAENAKAIDQLQDRLYAEGTRALLVILQGTDSSGKDGTVRAVFNTTGPIGVEVTPFKAPTAEELAHDFLWRIHKAVPAKG